MYADLVLLWEWEFDEDFIRILDRKCEQFRIQSYVIHPYNLAETETKIRANQFHARYFYDRASDANPQFEPVIRHLLRSGARPLNDPEQLNISLDKAVMHQQLQQQGVHVPYTIVLSPTRDWTKIKIGELIRLGEPFIIKPALGGGGVGVELNAKTLFDIVKAREGKAREKFLLQEKVLPIRFGDRRAWFRIYYICGKAISCWWDDLTHIYHRVTPEEEKVYGLIRLEHEMMKVAAVAKLQFFSSEIAIVDRETFVVVDYVNDQCDMRLKSRFADGVPDDVVDEIALHIVATIDAAIQKTDRSLRVVENS